MMGFFKVKGSYHSIPQNDLRFVYYIIHAMIYISHWAVPVWTGVVHKKNVITFTFSRILDGTKYNGGYKYCSNLTPSKLMII